MVWGNRNVRGQELKVDRKVRLCLECTLLAIVDYRTPTVHNRTTTDDSHTHASLRSIRDRHQYGLLTHVEGQRRGLPQTGGLSSSTRWARIQSCSQEHERRASWGSAAVLGTFPAIAPVYPWVAHTGLGRCSTDFLIAVCSSRDLHNTGLVLMIALRFVAAIPGWRGLAVLATRVDWCFVRTVRARY